MSINFPTSLDTTTELPNNRADATLAATNHPEDHNDLANAVLALEAKVGADSSAVTSSLDYKVTQAANPGHTHTAYLPIADIDDTPVNGETSAPISSNWAYDHGAASDPHTGYRLESADHTHQSTGAQAGQLDHGLALTGLTDDDHTQYALLAGRSGGQTLKGGTASGDDLTLMSTNHATKGDIIFGTSKYDEVYNRLGIGMTPTVPLDVTGRTILQATDAAAVLTLTGTITTAVASAGTMLTVSGTINGAGINPASLLVNTTFAPSASVTNGFGLRFFPTYAPPSTVTMSNVYGLFSQPVTGSAAGAVTNLIAVYAGKSLGTQIPTSTIGVSVDNMGAASVTTAIGISITKPTGATNNFYFSFDVADATAAGAYFGRLPILYAGALKYLHVFSA